ncbi:hypothetical protein [Thauera sp. 63]|uniref:hypothetical protein n=1 Tax=Thauera sp. 63 TaxID=497321 RepID=UPI0012FC65B5|nr:hypothetical protein [Thauera sp. 63]
MSIQLSNGYSDYVSHGSGPAPRSEIPTSGPVTGRFQQLSGGVLRYDTAPEDPGTFVQPVQQRAIRADVGTIYRSGVNGTTATPAHASYTANESVGGATGILASARNAYGNLTSVDNIKPTTLISYGGTQTQAQVLERMGVLARDSSGRYYEVGGNQTSPAAQSQESRESLPQVTGDSYEVEYFPTEIEDTLARAIDPLPQAIYQSALAKILEGTIGERDYLEIARLSGITPEDAKARAAFVEHAFSQQADSVARREGISDPQELWDWAQKARPDAYSRARHELVYGRNVAPMKALAREFFSANPPSVEALRKAGYEVSTTPAGHTVVNINGRLVSPAAAAKLGWL